MSDFRRIGVMVDCSRNAVMSMSALKRFIDCLQIMGYNALGLYMEDTYEVEDEPYFGYLRGRYTADELREIDAYALRHSIEVIPYIQTLAHFTNTSNLPHYSKQRKLFDLSDILLVGEEKTYEFIDRLFASLRRCFSSDEIHIGMDEAYMVGLGRYLDIHGYRDRFDVLLEHLRRVAEIAAKYGFSAQMWGDMFFRLCPDMNSDSAREKFEKIRKGLPGNVTLTYWNYYHSDKAHYDKMFTVYKSLCKNVRFAGGAWCWNGFAPNARWTIASMKPAIKSVLDNGIKDVMFTMWGDNGNECSKFALIHSLYALRRFADGEFDEKNIAKEFNGLFAVSYEDMQLLDLPDTIPNTEIKVIKDVVNPSKIMLYSDPFLGKYDLAIKAVAHIPYGDYAKQLYAAAERSGEFAYLFRSMAKLCSALEIKAELGLKTRKAYAAKDIIKIKSLIKDYDECISRVKEFYNEFEQLWLTDNKPFGFEIQDARLGGVILRLEHCRNRLSNYVGGKINKIEELEEKLLPFDDPDYLENNSYRQIISTGEM